MQNLWIFSKSLKKHFKNGISIQIYHYTDPPATLESVFVMIFHH